MQLAYLILGSNLNNKLQNLEDALDLISKDCGAILKKSKIYETAPWGNTNQPSYINQVLLIYTNHLPQELLSTILEIEKKHGRIRTTKYAERIIDIDILFYGQEILNETNLTIPHPLLQERNFVLVPLNEIVPNKIHPSIKKNYLAIIGRLCG